jgi:hypothetical protein
MLNSKLFKKAIELGLSICYVDIETSPYLTYMYELWKTNVSHKQIICPMQVTSIGWLWEGSEDVVVRGWDDSKNENGKFDILRNNRDYELLKNTCKLIASADIIIGQNSDSYDIKKLSWRLNQLKLPAMNQNLITLDTLKLSRKVFSPPSHKLDYRSEAYGFGGKIPQDMLDCIQTAMGNKKVQKERMIYNGKDVLDTRKIFWRELDSYILPKALKKMLRDYIESKEPTIKKVKPFCIKCAQRRQRRFDVEAIENIKEINYKCNNCGHKWRNKK